MFTQSVEPVVALDVSVLDGVDIARWVGTEMAFTWGDESRPDGDLSPVIWRHPSLPWSQFTSIWIENTDGARYMLCSQLGEPTDFYGFYVQRVKELPPLDERSRTSIFCTRLIDNLPTGLARIESRRVEHSKFTVEFTLGVGTVLVRFLAAEVHEQFDGRLEIFEGDESILVQIDGAAP